MMMTEAILNADTEHEVYFLLSAYVEAVRYGDKLHCMPECIRRLPLNGIADVRARFEKLVAELDVASDRLDDKVSVVLREALHVFGTACSRLTSLDTEGRQIANTIDAQAA